MSESYDVVVVGGGHNGLVAAIRLADAGWSVCVVERSALVGGAMASAELTMPGLVHDRWSTNQSLFLGSQFYRTYGDALAAHGARFVTSHRSFANVFANGTALRVERDWRHAADTLRAHHPGDGAGFTQLRQWFDCLAAHYLPIYSSPMPSLRGGWAVARAVWQLRPAQVVGLSRILLSSTRELGEQFFVTDEARTMAACWGLHLDYAPDVAGGALFPLMEIFSGLDNGMSLAEGGAGRVPAAMAGVLADMGGVVHTSTPVRRIVLRNGRAAGVECADGSWIRATRAVVANLSPGALWGSLLPYESLPPGYADQVRRYTYGPGTMMVHLALDGPIPWAAGADLAQFAYVHVATLSELAHAYSDALSGLLPRHPMLAVGQTSAVDPTRSPDHRQVVWIKVRCVPTVIRGDAADQFDDLDWGSAKERMADRVLAMLEEHAPGLADRVLVRHVTSPVDLAAANPSCVGGDSVAGSHHLRQSFFFRPVPGWSRYRTPVPGLWQVGAATWPGAGNNAVSGWLGAEQIMRAASSLPRRVATAVPL